MEYLYLVSKMHQDANNSASILLRIKRVSFFFFEENGKRFAVIFIRRRKKKIYKHTFNSTTQLNTTENFKENKELLVNTSKTAKQRNHITTRGWSRAPF